MFCRSFALKKVSFCEIFKKLYYKKLISFAKRKDIGVINLKTLGDILISEEPVSEIVMGNHALVRAMLESG